ncbi:methyl-accepting chemotaxis sensory transducer with Cache sensor [Thermincola ferriacetica]|uniref:Methyl-accepting chemotaxis sensory transducer with Cache sensor n=1 Tax=Thermincola ferriacetica TaxID=281456 RepID=A0A0L6W0L7_9FIRM|nr:hypothetical protein [Thermincola ferriacetica]KNZ68918.1 methyl-accepting chemotaxis sensory transducer with Cache sensor [Thermincola ferriacetica]
MFQRGTKVAVDSMQVGTTEVEQGVVLAPEAGNFVKEIVDGSFPANVPGAGPVLTTASKGPFIPNG